MYDHWYNAPCGAGFEADVALMLFDPFEAVLSAFEGATADLMAEEFDWEGLEPRIADPAETTVEFEDPFVNVFNDEWVDIAEFRGRKISRFRANQLQERVEQTLRLREMTAVYYQNPRPRNKYNLEYAYYPAA